MPNPQKMTQAAVSSMPGVLNTAPKIAPTKEFPLVFDPGHFYGSGKKDVAEYNHFSTAKHGVIQNLFAFVAPTTFLLLVLLGDINHFARYSGVLYISMWLYFTIKTLVQLINVLRRGDTLYKVLSHNSMPPRWLRWGITSKQYIYMNLPIETLSELTHIEGSAASYGFYGICIASSLSIAFFLIGMKLLHPCDFRFDFVDALMYVGVNCGASIGIFKMNYFSRLQMALHRIPILLGMILVPVAYAVQQYYLDSWYFGVASMALNWSLLVFFYKIVLSDNAKLSAKNADIKVSEVDKVRDEVNAASMKGILTECTGLLVAMSTIGLWMWDYDSICQYGCRGPTNAQC